MELSHRPPLASAQINTSESSEAIAKGHDLLHLDGSARAILTGERTALNFLAHLSGIATLTHRFVERLAGKPARLGRPRRGQLDPVVQHLVPQGRGRAYHD